MIGILGSGFGAYVYAPSLFFQSNQQILVTKKTYSFIKSRSDISFLLHRLLPFESERDLIKSSSSLILARRPFDSLPLVNNFTNSNFDHIYFEKPFADTPDNALLLHSLLLSKYINYSVNYILCFLDPPLIKNHTSSDTLSFVWNFMAHHYSNNLYNWKREHISGGGALRFYGVHFIALAYSLGYYYPISSSSTRITLIGTLFLRTHRIRSFIFLLIPSLHLLNLERFITTLKLPNPRHCLIHSL